MNLFVYGTLLFPEIRELVAGQRFLTKKAIIKGYQIYRVNGAEYPGIVQSDGNQVPGEVILDLSAEEFEKFDRYEGRLYHRKSITAETPAPISAEIYEIPKPISSATLSNEIWTKDWFEKNHFDQYVARMKEA